MVVFLGLVLPAQTTFGHDAPVIAPTRLDFDATQAPKNCNDGVGFRALVAEWVDPSVFSLDADRRLLVRIRRSPTGGKLADMVLLDATGVQLAQDHKNFASKTECHKVLYETARATAGLLGAFEKPPAPEPFTCPACPPPPALPEPARAQSPISRSLPITLPIHAVRKAAIISPNTRRAFFGAGVFFGTGIASDAAIGPQVSLGFVPSRHSPRIQIELDAAWMPQTLLQSSASEPLRVHVVPLFGALCYSRYVFRMCSGLTTTFVQADRRDFVAGNDNIGVTLAGHLRIGTEFAIAGPFSLRFDAYAQLRFWERSFGQELATIETQRPFGMGAVAMGVWSFE